MKLCKDCVHCSQNKALWVFGDGLTYAKCRAVLKEGFVPVGSPKRDDYWYCQTSRNSEQLCGREANNFVAKARPWWRFW